MNLVNYMKNRGMNINFNSDTDTLHSDEILNIPSMRPTYFYPDGVIPTNGKYPETLFLNKGIRFGYCDNNELPKNLYSNGNVYFDRKFDKCNIDILPENIHIKGDLFISGMETINLNLNTFITGTTDISDCDNVIISDNFVCLGNLKLTNIKHINLPKTCTIMGDLIIDDVDVLNGISSTFNVMGKINPITISNFSLQTNPN